MKCLENICCIITGAGGGVGRGIALTFAGEGASVAIYDINSQSLEETRQLIEKTGAKTLSRVIDITDISAIKGFINEVGGTFETLDVLANVAGIMPVSHIDTLTEKLADKILNVNLKAPIFFTKYAVIAYDYPVEGRSFLPTLLGEEQPKEERPLYFTRREGWTRYRGFTIQAVRLGYWKLLQNSPFASRELYNLKEDPMEQHNLIREKPKKVKALNALMMKHIQKDGRAPWQKPETNEQKFN